MPYITLCACSIYLLFLWLIKIRPLGRIFCSPEQSKLCFEARIRRVGTSKPLALAGSRKPLQSRGFYLLMKLYMDNKLQPQKRKLGRVPKIDKAIYRYTISFNQVEHTRFLSLFEQSGMKVKAHFITLVLFSKEIKSVKIDKSVMDFYIKLTELYGQFRAVGVNYNQIVKILYRNFSEKKAAAYLFKLEQQTAQMVAICKEIMALSQQLEQHITEKNKKNGR